MFDVEVHPQYARNGWIYLAYRRPCLVTRLHRRTRHPRRTDAAVEDRPILRR